VTSDPENIKVILATGSNNFEKGTSDRILMRHSLTAPGLLLGPFFHEAMESVLGEGVFNVDGEFRFPVLATNVEF